MLLCTETLFIMEVNFTVRLTMYRVLKVLRVWINDIPLQGCHFTLVQLYRKVWASYICAVCPLYALRLLWCTSIPPFFSNARSGAVGTGDGEPFLSTHSLVRALC